MTTERTVEVGVGGDTEVGGGGRRGVGQHWKKREIGNIRSS